jgi:hypothetical protein
MSARSILLIFSLAVLLAAPSPAALAEEVTGQSIYKEECAYCHGQSGQGTKKHPEPLAGGKSPAQLAKVIARTMPEDDDQKCSPDEARKVAAYIYDSFYSPDAIARRNPPRVELQHLTVKQYRNSVADILGSFRSPSKSDVQEGLRGEYSSGRNGQAGQGHISRIDPEVNFDFGVVGPDDEFDTEKFNPHQFTIRWDGSVRAPETGTYEFIVKSDQAVRLWVNDLKKPLIDELVKSGGDTEYRGSMLLLGGRSYSFRLEFIKGRQLNEKKLATAKPTHASVELLWKRPRHADEVIAARYLSPSRSTEVAVIETPFPPDDRSYGWERGTIVSKEWDGATTDGALECAAYVITHLPELAGVSDNAPDRGKKLRMFCRQFAQRAFGRPLSEADQRFYVDHQFDASPDLEFAVKRVVLLVLKSPRFLYPGVMEQTDENATASRLALALWDSLPDQALLDAAAKGKLKTRQEVAAQAQRMLADGRAKAKLHEFLLAWLRVDQSPELAKDPKRFPKFDVNVASDMRTSLELFLDDIVWRQSSDFRQLLLSDEYFINPRLAAFYGIDPPPMGDFVKMKLDSQRCGVLTQPYILSSLAYVAESSPIHRGVFIGRGILGITLRPPPNAFTPLAAELHPDLTTRERITLQTQPETCIACHGIINPLGFTLENFDAVGRFRAKENGKEVNARGFYESRSGTTEKFTGARPLANYLANSDEVHAAFCQQMFQHLVKQPIRAYGLDKPQQLQATFAQSGYSIQKLTIEIAVAAALDANGPKEEKSASAAAPSGSPPGLNAR